VVRNGAIEGSSACLTGADLAGDVETFLACLKEARKADLLGIEPWHMTVFGPWADQPRVVDVPQLAREEPCHLADLLGALVGGMARAYFLVRITTPPVAAGVSGVELARHASSVPTIFVIREIRHSVCPSCFPRTRDSLFAIALARACLILCPCHFSQA
jgi:hypothetical protein